MYDIYYVNSRGIRLGLVSRPYRLQTGDIFDYGWAYETFSSRRRGGFVSGFSKEVKEKNLTLTVEAGSRRDYLEALDHFFETVDYDVVHKKHGCLYVNGQYLPCYIFSSQKAEWEYGIEALDNTIQIVPDYSFWITEKKYLFRYIASPDKVFLDYPYNYAYDYASEHATHRDVINNTHYCACHFQAIFYGPCTDPSLVVDSHPYTVMTTLEEGEYLRLDTRDRTITKVTNAGDEINEFHNQRRSASIFTKITPGKHTVTWNGDFGVDMILYEERSEPKWS